MKLLQNDLQRTGARLLAAGLVATLCAAAPALAATDGDSPFLVGAHGELLKVHNGTYGELFPDGKDASPQASVLALDSITGDAVRRFLVPDTESVWLESSARLITDERAGVVYLLWESRVNGVHPLLKLVSFDGEQWGEVKEITAGVFASKGEPKLRVTHDTHGEGEETRERTVLHVSWWEEFHGVKEKRYASLILEDGQFVDADAVIDLSALLTGEGEGVPRVSVLDSLIRMQAGPQKDVVVMGFTDPELGRLVGLQVEVLPQALSRLADRIEEELGKLSESADLAGAQAAVRAAVDEMAGEFHEVGLALIRDDLMAFLAQLTEDGVVIDASLGGKMGGRVIWIGAKIGRTGLESPGDPALLEIVGSEGRTHHLAVTLAASWEAPELVGVVEPHLFLSRDGSEALVAWLGERGETVHYVTTGEDNLWSDVQNLYLMEGLGLDQALDLLERKALDR